MGRHRSGGHRLQHRARPLLIAPCVAAIVGLHFFPLAKLFNNRLHYVSGAALTAWPIGCALLLPETQAATAAALGAGAILWASAATTLLIAARLRRRLADPQ